MLVNVEVKTILVQCNIRDGMATMRGSADSELVRWQSRDIVLETLCHLDREVFSLGPLSGSGQAMERAG